LCSHPSLSNSHYDTSYRSVIRITLENVAGLPVDFLRLAFDDSTILPAQQALNDGGLSVFDTYETEYDLIHRPMFSWNSPKELKTIEPGQKVTLTISSFGKSGWLVDRFLFYFLIDFFSCLARAAQYLYRTLTCIVRNLL
jgi:hypothetical protein